MYMVWSTMFILLEGSKISHGFNESSVAHYSMKVVDQSLPTIIKINYTICLRI